MNRFLLLTIVILLSVLSACNFPKKQEQQVPEERKLSSETMEKIFYEMHVADAMVTLHLVNVNGHTSITQYQTDSLLYEGIYEKYGCTRESFEESVLWYLQNDSNELKDIYERVVERFNLEMAAFEINVSDSTANTEEENTL